MHWPGVWFFVFRSLRPTLQHCYHRPLMPISDLQNRGTTALVHVLTNKRTCDLWYSLACTQLKAHNSSVYIQEEELLPVLTIWTKHFIDWLIWLRCNGYCSNVNRNFHLTLIWIWGCMMTYLFEKSCPKFNVNLEKKYIIKWIKG